jgi:MFS family permease
VGILAGGRAAARARRARAAAPALLAGACQAIASGIFLVTFFPVPLWVRLPGHILAVAFLLAAIPALAAMISQVVPAAIRGISFSLTGFLTTLVSAASPLLIGWLADRFPVAVDGVMRGNLAVAFGIVTPLIFLGALVVLNGRRHVAADIEGVDALTAKLAETGGTS